MSQQHTAVQNPTAGHELRRAGAGAGPSALFRSLDSSDDDSEDSDSDDGDDDSTDDDLAALNFGFNLEDILHDAEDEAKAVADEPRLIRKGRAALLKLLLAGFSIRQQALQLCSEDAKSTRKVKAARRHLEARMSRPWATMVEAADELAKSLKDRRVSQVEVIGRGIAVFDHLARSVLLPPCSNKEYTRNEINRSEAKAIPHFVKRYTALCDTSVFTKASDLARGQTIALSAAHPVICCRLAVYALSPCTYANGRMLDLSRLPSSFDLSDLPILLAAFAIEPNQVSWVSLARNNVSDISHWLSMPFENIVALDLHGNARLSRLPISFVKLPRLQAINTTNTNLVVGPSNPLLWHPVQQRQPRPGRSGSASACPDSNLAKGVISLISLSVGQLLKELSSPYESVDCQKDRTRQWAAYGLAPHLAAMLAHGYVCELCRTPCIPGGNGWLHLHVEIRLVVRSGNGEDGKIMKDGKAGKEVKLRGRICVACHANVMRKS